MTKKRGAVSFKAGGETYKLKFSTNAMVLFEETHGVDFTKVQDYFDQASHGAISFKAMRALLYAGLSDNHGITIEAAGGLIDELGFTDAMVKVAEAIQAAFPKPERKSGNDQAAPAKE